MLAKLTSTLLSVILTLFTLFPALQGARNETFTDEALADLKSPADYVNFIQENGAPAMDTGTFHKALEKINLIRRLFTGQIMKEREETYLDVTIDESVTEMCNMLLADSDLDVEFLLKHIPNALGPVAMLKKGVSPDLGVIRHRVFELSDQVRQDGHTLLATILYLFGVFFSSVDHIDIYGVEEGKDLVVYLDVTYRDGTTETVDPDVVYNTETHTAYAKPGYGVAGTGFNVDMDDLVLYTVISSWQRKFGFGLLYDALAFNPAFVYTTRRFHFDYAGKEWMLQIWKGNYSLTTNGGEVGLYNRAPGGNAATFYYAASDDEMLEMSMEILHGEDSLLKRGPEKTWWITGFKFSKTIYRPQDLTMRFEITFEDAEMMNAFLEAVDNEASHDVTYTVDGLTVCGVW